ncbi:5-oxoprolinase subunit PxpA [Sinorhizobium meliloti]|uniref:5-oxoprolinase subunit PxpA n=1 Tax=Rhizobium meliloti TaxID=382 RepID=UPI0004274422|nr:5-oxoprolinase subunit PxpA [Sinorhizobium meliloti]MDW9356456.1 5-oxoprolinase subunit PxpA [Sinorhizobium meliloti]MDW9592409.1 5-oxoprolinase subunit PxpA [Sinorhizobium meliloti]MDW9655384.1 5-oxoprolinase subunit PxpA [Sinorhizobium meliloti]MDW9915186.1 5-oxoprolinase subunit PxpA [Sinorhizobium meliloti]MDW9939793.1 5-oxoprolinase subunit PxpA [Sinorhizobium meliloti]
MKSTVDINCDMGEGFGRWRIGDTSDTLLIPHISSANIAAGFHAGDPNLIDDTVKLAAQHGVAVGAHPGFNDLQGFGRRRIGGSNKEIVNDIIYQVGALREFCRRHGTSIRHVKPHGALYMELAANPDLSDAFIQYMRTAAPDVPVLCMGISSTYTAARLLGHPVVRELYADRDYDDSGSIVFTRDAGRPDPKAIARKVLRACKEGKVRTVSGADIDIEFESICFHSDTLGALEIVREMRNALVAEGVRIAPVSHALEHQ